MPVAPLASVGVAPYAAFKKLPANELIPHYHGPETINIVAVFVGSNPNEPTGFPGIRVGRTFEDGLYLAVMILWIPFFLALYRAFDKSVSRRRCSVAIGVICLGAAMIKTRSSARELAGQAWHLVWPGSWRRRLICGTLVHRRRRSPWLDSSSSVPFQD
jgi:hypothetical protein